MDLILHGQRPSRHDGVEAARALMEAQDIDPPHAKQVARLALQLFDATRYLHKLGVNERFMLEAAGLLHDLGHNRDPLTHHKHSRDMILEAELPVFTERERRIIACVARYHRKAHPKPAHRVYADLRHKDKVIVSRLAAVLRVADGLDRCHMASVESITTTHEGNHLFISVVQHEPNETDIWGANRKRRLLEELYDIEVTISTRDTKP